MLLWNDAAGPALFPWALPVAHSRPMHRRQLRHCGHSAEFFDDDLSRVHPNQYCSDFRYGCKRYVANIETTTRSDSRYDLKMSGVGMARKLVEALKFAGISQADLARQLTDKLGRSIDRAAVNKMVLTHPKKGQKPRKISADEMLAIEEITGFPLTAHSSAQITNVRILSWINAGKLKDVQSIMPADIKGIIPVAGLSPGDWVAFEVEGDSMDRVAPPGAFICVDRNDRALVDRKFYVFSTPDGSATFKRYRSDPDRMQPFSNNPEHETMRPKDDIDVFGRAHCVIVITRL